jgi:peptidoglycan biosynthesis protein MviN/MurJ (putative lipid II flippase)
MAVVLLLLRGEAVDWLAALAGERVLHLLSLILGGAATYFAVLFGTGFRMTHLHGASTDAAPV